MAKDHSKKHDHKSRLLPVSNVLQAALGNGKSALSEQFTRWKLWRCWEEVVGSSISKTTQPVGYTKGRLYVWVSSSTQMQELRFMVGDIKTRINDYLGTEYVKFIQFTLDKKLVPSEGADRRSLEKALEKSSGRSKKY